jgi:hypothetical protein
VTSITHLQILEAKAKCFKLIFTQILNELFGTS